MQILNPPNEALSTEQAAAFEVRVARHAALADAARLRIVDLLTVSDYSPTELQAELGIPSNLLSHHLRTLESAGLTARQQSEADKRRSYVVLVPGALDLQGRMEEFRARRVLFVCRSNNPRSQFAAALWRRASPIHSDSAGMNPAKKTSKKAIKVAARYGVDLERLTPRLYNDETDGEAFTVTVCDKTHEEMPGRGIHWSIPDPMRLNTEKAFEQAFADISRRIQDLAARLMPA